MDKFKQKFLKINLLEESFIDKFLEYLQNNDNVPLDIINSKIEIIDFMYIPLIECRLNATVQVSATIGKDRVEWEKEKTGRVKVEYKKDFWGDVYRYETPEEDFVANTYTDWSDQKFTVSESCTDIFCGYNAMVKHIKDEIKNDSSFVTEYRNKKIKLLDIDVNTTVKFNECEEAIKGKLKKKIAVVLRKKGDHCKNLQTSDMNITKEITCFWEPIGYIKYHYGSDKKDYYFIKSLYSEKTIESSIPIDNEFIRKNSVGCGLCLQILIFYSAMCYLVYLLTNIIDLSYSKYLFYFVLGILLIDFYSIFLRYSINNSKNLERRQKYINSLFKANGNKLKKLICNLNKPYKE